MLEGANFACYMQGTSVLAGLVVRYWSGMWASRECDTSKLSMLVKVCGTFTLTCASVAPVFTEWIRALAEAGLLSGQ